MYVMRRLDYILEDEHNNNRPRPIYVGRPDSASPATGSAYVHSKEQRRLVEQALTWQKDKLRRPFERIENPNEL
jgi:2-oxoglutarate dehydrogenase E1 component